jgi:hypothetical protein
MLRSLLIFYALDVFRAESFCVSPSGHATIKHPNFAVILSCEGHKSGIISPRALIVGVGTTLNTIRHHCYVFINYNNVFGGKTHILRRSDSSRLLTKFKAAHENRAQLQNRTLFMALKESAGCCGSR